MFKLLAALIAANDILLKLWRWIMSGFDFFRILFSEEHAIES
jgi:hypothetical protein